MTKIKLGEISMIALFKTLIVSLYDIWFKNSIRWIKVIAVG
jgi:hypothetical protein